MVPAVAVAMAGALAGGMVDAIAGGGGLLTLPTLVFLGLPLNLAIATNKGQATFGSAASFATYWRRANVDRKRAPVALVLAAVGSALGATSTLALRVEQLRPAVVALLLVSASAVVLRGRARPVVRPPQFALPTVAVVSLGLGGYDGFFGPGVGALLIIAFVTLLGDSFTFASGNAKVNNFASNATALTIFAIHGAVSWRLAVPMGLASAVGAWGGARYALQHRERFVRRVVIVVACAVAAKLAFDIVR